MSQSLGRPLRLSHGDIVRWRAQLLVTGTCHVWMGAVGSDGYGRIAIRNREDGARTLAPHQVGARLGYGPIPAGATVLHPGRPHLAADIDPPRVRSDRPAPGHRLAHVLALLADPQMPQLGAATQPDLAVMQHRRPGRDRPVPEPRPDLVRGQRPGTVLRVADRDPPVPVGADAPIHT